MGKRPNSREGCQKTGRISGSRCALQLGQRPIRMFCPDFVKSVNQNNIVVHDDSGERNNTSSHNRAEFLGNHQAKQHADRGHDADDKTNSADKAVELRHQQGAMSSSAKLNALLINCMVLACSSFAPLKTARTPDASGVSQPFLNFCNFLLREHTGRHVRSRT